MIMNRSTVRYSVMSHGSKFKPSISNNENFLSNTEKKEQ